MKRGSKVVSIYVLIDPRDDNIRYVGKTEKRLQHRLRSHVNDKGTTRKNNWIRLLKKLELIPTIKLIEIVPECCWERYEMFWIRYYRELGYDLTNSTIGGERIEITDEIRAKMSASAKIKVFTEQHRLNMGKARLGAKHTEETKRKQALSKIGDKNPQRQRVFTEEDCKRMSEISKKRVFTPEYRQKLSDANRRRVVTEETKRKISESKRGKVLVGGKFV